MNAPKNAATMISVVDAIQALSDALDGGRLKLPGDRTEHLVTRTEWLEAAAAAWDAATWPSERDRLRALVDEALDGVDVHAVTVRHRYGRTFAARVEVSAGGVELAITADATERADGSFEWDWRDDWQISDTSIGGVDDLRSLVEDGERLDGLLGRDGLNTVDDTDGLLSRWATAAARAHLVENGDR